MLRIPRWEGIVAVAVAVADQAVPSVNHHVTLVTLRYRDRFFDRFSLARRPRDRFRVPFFLGDKFAGLGLRRYDVNVRMLSAHRALPWQSGTGLPLWVNPRK